MNIETDLEQMSFGQVLQYYRMDRQMSISELAAATMMSKGAISMLERGLRQPRWITLRRLATGLKLTASEATRLSFKATSLAWMNRRPGRPTDPVKQAEADHSALMSILRGTLPILGTTD